MVGLFGKLEAEAPISSGMLEGNISLFEKGFCYKGPGINGQAYGDYHFIERLENLGQLPLGRADVRMIFFTTFGERFDVRFAISEHYYHVLKERMRRE